MDIPDDIQEKTLLLAQTKLMKTQMLQRGAPMNRKKLAVIREEIGSLIPIDDPLVWLQPGRERDSSHLNNDSLKDMLEGVQLGLWTLCAHSLNYLETVVNERRPTCILEMGSGVSTLALQVFCKPLREAGHSVRIVSVEQEERFAAETRAMLAKHNLEEGVEVIVCPPFILEGLYDRTINSYNLSNLPEVMGGDMADFVLIDGPLGPPGTRVQVVPDLLQLNTLAPNAYFLMDDALRDGEMWIYDIWAERTDIKLDGVLWVGKGFLAGKVLP